MKTCLLFLISFLFISEVFPQNSISEKIENAFVSGDSLAIRKAIIDASCNSSKLVDNDTIVQVSRIMEALSVTYLRNEWGGMSDYRNKIKEGKLIFIQPEVNISFWRDFDYEGIMENKYQDTSGGEDEMPAKKGSIYDSYVRSYHTLIPFKRVDKSYPLFKTTAYESQNVDRNRIVVLDSVLMKQMWCLLGEKIDRVNQKEVSKVLGIDFFADAQGIYADFEKYNFWVDNIIFNDGMNQCIVQFSTRNSSYQAFLIRINQQWRLVYNKELMHVDYGPAVV